MMKSINLLPRRKKSEQHFVTMMAGVIGISVIGCLLTFYAMTQSEHRILDTENKLATTEQRVRQLAAARQIDPLTQDYNTFQAQIDELKKSRKYWPATLQMLTGNLPNASRIISVDSDTTQTMHISLEFQSLTDVADYLILLQQSGEMETIAVKTITRVARTTGGGVAANTSGDVFSGLTGTAPLANLTPATPTPTPTLKGGTTAVSKSTIAVPTPTPSPLSGGEDLLKQLSQIMAGKLSTTPPGASAAPTAATRTPGTAVETAKPAASPSNVTVYAVSLEAKLKSNTTK